MPSATRNIVLIRENLSQPWGFRLHGGREIGKSITVDRVQPGGLADHYGVRVADTILQIGHERTIDMTHDDAQDAILRGGNRIDLLILRSTQSDYRLPQGGGPVKSVVHQQYNSPIGLYSADNVADTMMQQVRVLTNGTSENEKVDVVAMSTPVLQRSQVYRVLQEEQRHNKLTVDTNLPVSSAPSQTSPRSPRGLSPRPAPGSPRSARPTSPFGVDNPQNLQSQSFIKLQREMEIQEINQDVPHSYVYRPVNPSNVSPRSGGSQYQQTQQTHAQPQQTQYQRQQQDSYSRQYSQEQQYRQQQEQQQHRQQQEQQLYRQQQEQQQYRQQHSPQQQYSPQARQVQQPQYSPTQRQQQSPQAQQVPPTYQRQTSALQVQLQTSTPRPQQQQQQQQPPKYAQQMSSPQQRAVYDGQTYQQPVYNSTGYPEGDPAWSPSTVRKNRAAWPPPQSNQQLPTSYQSLKWAGVSDRATKKFIWPPPKPGYADYSADGEVVSPGAVHPNRFPQQETYIPHQQQYGASASRPHTTSRGPTRLAAQAWQPYMDEKNPATQAHCVRPTRRLKNFNDVFVSNSTPLPPTYRPPPGTQH